MDKRPICPRCETNEYIRVSPEYVGYSAYCDNCYDVDCDDRGYYSLTPVAHDTSQLGALEGLAEMYEDSLEHPRFKPSSEMVE